MNTMANPTATRLETRNQRLRSRHRGLSWRVVVAVPRVLRLSHTLSQRR